METTGTTESVPFQERYQILKQQAERLATEYSGLIVGQPTDRELHEFVRRGIKLDKNFHSIIQSAGDGRDIVFPQRGDLYQNIAGVLLGTLDRLPYKDLSTEEMDRYIKLLASRKGVSYGGFRSDGWYRFNPSYFLRVASSEEELLQRVVGNSRLVLTLEQEERIAEHEDNVFKLHIAVPEERRIDILKLILAGREHDSDLANRLRREKEMRGEEPKITMAEFEQQGAQLNLAAWKMCDFTRPRGVDIADFVFYVPENSPQVPQRAAKMAKQLAAVIKPADLSSVTTVPRYNVPVRIEGEAIPGLSIAQGDGDFKDYLLLKHGTEGLERYFDAERNFALRNQPQIPEAIKQIV